MLINKFVSIALFFVVFIVGIVVGKFVLTGSQMPSWLGVGRDSSVVNNNPSATETLPVTTSVDGSSLTQNTRVRYASGIIKSVAGNILTITVWNRVNSKDLVETEKTIALTNATQIFQMVPKSQAVFEKDLQEYRNLVSRRSAKPALPPQMFDKKIVDRGALVQGKSVDIVIDQSVANQDTLTASSIEISYFSPPELKP